MVVSHVSTFILLLHYAGGYLFIIPFYAAMQISEPHINELTESATPFIPANGF